MFNEIGDGAELMDPYFHLPEDAAGLLEDQTFPEDLVRELFQLQGSPVSPVSGSVPRVQLAPGAKKDLLPANGVTSSKGSGEYKKEYV